MKKSTLMLTLGLVLSQLTYANQSTTTLIFENKTKMTLKLTGASVGCGPPQIKNYSAETIHCEYEGQSYYDFILPTEILIPGASTNADVIAYRDKNSFGRVGVQYTDPNKPDEISCGLIMDYNNNNIVEIRLNTIDPSQPFSCTYQRNANTLHITLFENEGYKASFNMAFAI